MYLTRTVDTRTLADSGTNLHWSTIYVVYIYTACSVDVALYIIVYLYIYLGCTHACVGYSSRMTSRG